MIMIIIVIFIIILAQNPQLASGRAKTQAGVPAPSPHP